MKIKFGNFLNFLFPTKENNFYPRIFRGRFLEFLFFFAVFWKIIFFCLLFYLPKTPFFAEISKETILFLLNKTRSSFNLPPLRENPSLSLAAYYKAKDMLEKEYFSHWSPEGQWLLDWLRKVNYQYQVAGENLAIGFVDGEEVHQAWMRSPSHRSNILNAKYEEVGIAVLSGKYQGKEVTVVVQIFGTPKRNFSSKESSFLQQKSQSKKETPTPFPTPSETGTSFPSSLNFETKPDTSPPIEKEPPKLVLSESIFSSNDFFSELILFSLLYAEKYFNFFLRVISLILACLLLVSIFVEIKIQYPRLILKGIIFILLFYSLSLIQKEGILEILPPHLLVF